MERLIGCIGDEAVQVRDSAAWTIGRICEHVPSVLLTGVTLPPLLQALGAGLEGEPRVATNVCWVSGCVSLMCSTLCCMCTVEPSIVATLGEQHFGHYIGVAFIEGLFCTQSVHL